MVDPLRIAICEDTKADEELLLHILRSSGIPTLCSVFTSGEAFLASYQPQSYDLILTDIYMNGISGVDMIARIREIDADVPVAFITTSTDHALEGYRLSALKYIEKPYREKEIYDILKLASMERDNAPALLIQQAGKKIRIRFSRILYLEQQSHQLVIHMQDGIIEEIREKLSLLLPQLEENSFFQPHKSFSVNLAFVRSIDPELKCFVMQDGKCVPIRRESMSAAKDALKTYLFDRTRGGFL